MLSIALLLAAGQAQSIATPAPAAPAKEKKVCRVYKETGTRLPPPKICHTAAEWTEIDAANRSDAAAALVRTGATPRN